jgi:hypothetical protein
MVARGFVIAAAAIAVCACASTAPRERASLQNSMYMVGDNTPLLRASAGSAAAESEGQFPVIKRLYWFFAGR